MEDDILKQQMEYYRARAREYDEWFYRKGRYDHGYEANNQWFLEVDMVRTSLQSIPRMHSILEIACGTGIWTRELAKIGNQIVALDASAEMIAINRSKLVQPNVEYREVDVFTWEPEINTYDLVAFGFWLSHVPPDRLNIFLQKVYQALKPDGRIFMVDSRRVVTSTAIDQQLPDDQTLTLKRKLNDGREYTIVKIYYEPDELEHAFAQVGFEVNVMMTPNYFIYVNARKVT